MYEQLDRSSKQNRSSRSPRQQERQWTPAQADEPVEMKPPAFHSDINMVNVPAYSPQLRASAPIDPQTTVVPPPLVFGLLNVVGEHHGISDQRRKKEKKLCETLIGGPYWEEHEFKVAAFDSSGNVTDGHDRADPWNLRMLSGIRSVESAIAHIQNGIMNQPLSDLSQNTSCDWLLDSTEFISGHYGELKKGKDGLKWRESNGKEAVQELGKKSAHVDTLKSEFAKIFNGYQTSSPGEIINLLKDLRNELISIEEIIVRNEENNASLGFEEIRKRRSDEMKKEANAKASKRGVWKIGDDHCPDMEALENAPKFNLVRRKDFDALYERLEAEKRSTSHNKGKRKRIESPQQGESNKSVRGEGYNSMKAPELRELVKNRGLNAVLKGKYNKPVSKAKKEELMAVLSESDNKGKGKMSPSVTTE